MAGGSTGNSSNPLLGQSNTQQPQWLKGLQLGTQISQMGQRPQIQPQLPQHPMMGQTPGFSPGAVGSAVPGAQGMAPPMANGGMGMQGPMNNGQQGGINPQLLAMLMRSR